MAKTKLSVETPYGTFTRSTDRTYTHVVLVCGRPDSYFERYYDTSYREKELARYKKVVETGILPSGYQGCTLEDYARWVEQLTAEIAGRPAEKAAAIEKNRVAIANKAFHAETWCGRPDLAQKAIAKLQKDYVLVEAVPVS